MSIYAIILVRTEHSFNDFRHKYTKKDFEKRCKASSSRNNHEAVQSIISFISDSARGWMPVTSSVDEWLQFFGGSAWEILQGNTIQQCSQANAILSYSCSCYFKKNITERYIQNPNMAGSDIFFIDTSNEKNITNHFFHPTYCPTVRFHPKTWVGDICVIWRPHFVFRKYINFMRCLHVHR